MKRIVNIFLGTLFLATNLAGASGGRAETDGEKSVYATVVYPEWDTLVNAFYKPSLWKFDRWAHFPGGGIIGPYDPLPFEVVDEDFSKARVEIFRHHMTVNWEGDVFKRAWIETDEFFKSNAVPKKRIPAIRTWLREQFDVIVGDSVLIYDPDLVYQPYRFIVFPDKLIMSDYQNNYALLLPSEDYTFYNYYCGHEHRIFPIGGGTYYFWSFSDKTIADVYPVFVEQYRCLVPLLPRQDFLFAGTGEEGHIETEYEWRDPQYLTAMAYFQGGVTTFLFRELDGVTEVMVCYSAD